MPFVTKAEYNTIISTAIIDQITGGDDSIIDFITDTAEQEMRQYLEVRYNVDGIFSMGVDDRHKLVMMYLKDIALYHLFSKYNQKQMPLIREQRYKKAIEWLEKVNKQELNPWHMPASGEPNAGLVKAGGNNPRNNYQE